MSSAVVSDMNTKRIHELSESARYRRQMIRDRAFGRVKTVVGLLISGSVIMHGLRQRRSFGALVTRAGVELSRRVLDSVLETTPKENRNAVHRGPQQSRSSIKPGYGDRHDLVDEASSESFPASDAPSFTASTGTV